MYFDDLTIDLKSNVKLLADDTSFFSENRDLLGTTNTPNSDFDKWADSRF